MNEKRALFYSVMRNIVLVAVAAYVVFLLVYAGGSKKPFEEVEGVLEESLDLENLKKQDSQTLKKSFGFNGADYSGVMYFSSESSISAEEVLLVRVESEDQVEGVRESIEDRIASRMKDFEGYMPQEEALLKDACVVIRGKYVFYAVSPKAQEYRAVFEKSL